MPLHRAGKIHKSVGGLKGVLLIISRFLKRIVSLTEEKEKSLTGMLLFLKFGLLVEKPDGIMEIGYGACEALLIRFLEV